MPRDEPCEKVIEGNNVPLVTNIHNKFQNVIFACQRAITLECQKPSGKVVHGNNAPLITTSLYL